ncbi:GDYXXLXY domain-containing protein [Litchfieldia salsa]|uniref:Uncharacterized membrane-anchored protein n=1 Tax=Litchfieldia salsa TaxID=930152 RepID=A0A1H0UV35_9BACI|nr:GDYXXLXY domain-containing protein [Litchfieldia salsa]SDP70064.1 Uncharacterized membrane-anchored protein [Litchfieldia salsa]
MKKFIPLGYLGSIILILTSIIYFFAGNWATFSRIDKIGLSISAMMIFYLLSVVASKFISHHSFLGKWFIVTGAITFGVSVALIGQIYNSHADSYILFAVWLIPTFAFALITRYLPFWLMSYFLFHFTFWFYMNPSSYRIVRSDFQEWRLYFILALINVCIFALTFFRFFNYKYIRYLSYITTHAFLIGISFFELFNPYSGWTNLLYIAFTLVSYYYFSSKKVDRGLTIILFIMAILYVNVKLIELPFLFDLGFFAYQLSGIFLSISLIFGGIYLARKITAQHQSTPTNHVLRRILIVIVTLFGSGMFVTSFGGILYMITENEYASVFLSLLFITLGLLLKKLDPAARHTLLFIGFFSGLAEAIFLSLPVTLLFLLLGVAVTASIKDGIVRFISYTTALGCSLSLVLGEFNLTEYLDIVFLGFILLNSVVAYLFKTNKAIHRIGYFYFLIFLLSLTFLENGVLLEVIYSLTFFLVTTYLIVYFSRIDEKAIVTMTTIFWLGFLVFTYYDFVWSLVHKSLSFFIIGLILLLVTRLIDRHTYNHIYVKHAIPFPKQSVSILIIIILQIGLLGYQIGSNEWLLKNGKVITLNLSPIDPRSLLQGDYLRLGYEIAEQDSLMIESGAKLYVLLEKNQDGIYEKKKVITERIDPKSYPLNQNEALITGKYNGYDTIIYGIESYFVQEGTGLEIERNAKTAKVIVSKKGDALLLSVE